MRIGKANFIINVKKQIDEIGEIKEITIDKEDFRQYWKNLIEMEEKIDLYKPINIFDEINIPDNYEKIYQFFKEVEKFRKLKDLKDCIENIDKYKCLWD